MDKKNRTILIVVLILVILVALLLVIFLISESAKKLPGAVCGNDKCELGETPTNCPQDCIVGGLVCGDGICQGAEADNTTQWYCPQDCKTDKCGNGKCDSGETWINCNEDCCAPENAGSNKQVVCCSGLKIVDICEGPFLMPCPGIHYYCTNCGNGICGEHETQWNCAEDCKETVNITKGARGFVTLTKGDCMPPADPSRCTKTFLRTTVNIYPAVKQSNMNGNYYRSMLEPIATTTSDGNGYYRIELDKGSYSVMVVDPDNSSAGDYCNSLANGYACLINVTDSLVKFNIDIDHATH